MPHLSLIFPAFNEARAITETLARFVAFTDTQKFSFEVIVVNDGSTDETSSRVRTFMRAHPSVQLIEHAVNQGYGAALRTGFAAAQGTYVFFTDSDGQFQPQDLDQTLPLLAEDTLVLGYRAERAEGFMRRLNASLWRLCIAIVLGVRVRDLDCAWKVIPRRWLAETKLISRGAFINAELLYYARRSGLKFREIPVQHFARRFGSPTGAKFSVVQRAVRELGFFLLHR